MYIIADSYQQARNYASFKNIPRIVYIDQPSKLHGLARGTHLVCVGAWRTRRDAYDLECTARARELLIMEDTSW